MKNPNEFYSQEDKEAMLDELSDDELAEALKLHRRIVSIIESKCLNDLNCESPICPDHGDYDLWEGYPSVSPGPLPFGGEAEWP